MKIGVSSYSFSKYFASEGCDYFKICDIAKDIGFDGIEFIQLERYTDRKDLLTLAAEIRKHCDKIGLEICAYTVPADFMAEDIEAEMKLLRERIDIAEVLGARLLRHDVCYKLPQGHNYTWRDAIEKMVPYIREISEYAEKKGIKTCTENHGLIFQRPEIVESLMLAVDRDNYGWLFDMGNFLCADASPVQAIGIAARHVFHVHAKDFLFKSGEYDAPDGFFQTVGGNYIRGTVLSHGTVPVKSCINALKREGYDGYVSVEFEGLEECLPSIKTGYEYLKKLI